MNTTPDKFPGTPRTLSLVMISLLASPFTVAADAGWFAGASIGETSASLRLNHAHLSVLPAGVTLTDLYYEDSDTGFKVFGGYQFNTYLALEGGHFDLGDYDFNASTSPLGSSNGNFDVDGWYLDAVGTVPLTANLALLGRTGFSRAYTKTHLQGTGAAPAFSPTIWSRDWNPKLGIGLQYALTEKFDLRLEAERYHLDEPARNKGDIELYSLGLVYRFGNTSRATREVASAPVTLVARAAPPAATPTPAPTPPPAPPTPIRVVFSADALFDFDQSIIRQTGTQELSEFVENLVGVSFDNILVTGHTDRIGNRDYNLGLSQRRADAVKDYLVRTGNIPATKITSRGMGSVNARIGPNECVNTGGRAAIILCLQPDRRVEVEVIGTRQ